MAWSDSDGSARPSVPKVQNIFVSFSIPFVESSGEIRVLLLELKVKKYFFSRTSNVKGGPEQRIDEKAESTEPIVRFIRVPCC